MLSHDSLVLYYGAHRVVYLLVEIADPIKNPVDYVGAPQDDKVESMSGARNCQVHCAYESPGHALQPLLIDLVNLSLSLLIIHFSHIDTM